MLVYDLFLTAFADSVQSSVALFDKPKNALFGWVGVGKVGKRRIESAYFSFWVYGWC